MSRVNGYNIDFGLSPYNVFSFSVRYKGALSVIKTTPSAPIPLHTYIHSSNAILAYHAHVRVLNPANQHGLRNLILDISVAHPIAAFNINFKKKRNAAMTREREKIGKYSRQASDNNLDFLPLAFETFGSWGPIMRRFFEDIIAEAARHRHELKGPIAEYWMQRISAALHFGCANLLISRMQRVSEAAMVNRDESTNPDLRLVNPQL